MLQPLDTHVFATFKRELHLRQTEARSGDPEGLMPPGEWIHAATAAIGRGLVERGWSSSFRANGVLDASGPTRESILGNFEHENVGAPSAPSSAELDELAGSRGGNFGPLALRASQRKLAAMALAPPVAAPPMLRLRRLLPPLGLHIAHLRPPPPLPPPAEAGPAVSAEQRGGLRRTRSGATY